MKIQAVTDEGFKKYGAVVGGYDFSELIGVLERETEKPEDRTVYVPSCEKLESTGAFAELQNGVYGGMPIQIGYCNGANAKLNCLEYHRDSEVNIAADDVVLLLADKRDIACGKIGSERVEAFELKKGMAVQLYETTLHYAPARREGAFRVAIVLPKDTNTEKPRIAVKNEEDRLLWARNKWLLAHEDTDEARSGAHIGITGKNIDLAE